MATICYIIPSLVLLLVLVEQGLSYSGGAPDRACYRMEPGHGGPLPVQKFVIEVNTTYFSPGNPVQVTLKSVKNQSGETPFLGILLQARIPGETTKVGSFNHIPEGIDYLTCDNPNDSITHKNKTPKTVVQVIWDPPATFDFVKQIQFVATFVERYEDWNKGVTSKILTFGSPVKTTISSPTVASETCDESWTRFC